MRLWISIIWLIFSAPAIAVYISENNVLLSNLFLSKSYFWFLRRKFFCYFVCYFFLYALATDNPHISCRLLWLYNMNFPLKLPSPRSITASPFQKRLRIQEGITKRILPIIPPAPRKIRTLPAVYIQVSIYNAPWNDRDSNRKLEWPGVHRRDRPPYFRCGKSSLLAASSSRARSARQSTPVLARRDRRRLLAKIGDEILSAV